MSGRFLRNPIDAIVAWHQRKPVTNPPKLKRNRIIFLISVGAIVVFALLQQAIHQLFWPETIKSPLPLMIFFCLDFWFCWTGPLAALLRWKPMKML